MKKVLFGVFTCFLLFACNDKAEEQTDTATATSSATADANKTTDELLPMSETESVKRSMLAFTRGDVEGMTADYADTAFYLWSSLDSIRGKQKIQEYYKGRWALIDSLNYSEFILVPLKVNMQQSMYAPTGKWVLAWTFAHVKYKNGKKLDFWVHNVYHYNSANKIDFVGQYLDRRPIMEATKSI
jgi:hypothetical protein